MKYKDFFKEITDMGLSSKVSNVEEGSKIQLLEKRKVKTKNHVDEEGLKVNKKRKLKTELVEVAWVSAKERYEFYVDKQIVDKYPNLESLCYAMSVSDFNVRGYLDE